MAKIRNELEFEAAVDRCKVRAKRELTDILFASKTPSRKPVVLRGLYAMTYSTYEGFCRDSIAIWADFVSGQGIPLSKCNYGVLCAKLKQEMLNISGTDSSKALSKVIQQLVLGERNVQLDRQHVSNTNSNLNSKILESFVYFFSSETSTFIDEHRFIDDLLLQRRNKIVHGVLDGETYLEITPDDVADAHERVLTIIEIFSDGLSNAVSLKQYLRGTLGPV